MKNVRIVGVPEHFNLPWYLGIDNGEYRQAGIDLQWMDVPEGTGRMCQMLRDDETDLAVILTEGILKDISNGNESVIVQKYVKSPLQWGVFVAADSPIHSLEDLKYKKAAISRKGSGSQLMTYVLAKDMQWSSEDLSFEVVHTIDGAIEALTHGVADYFLWDRFMTQPVVDKEIFRRVGICPTPWPSFVIVARKEFAKENRAVINSVLEIINQTTSEFKQIPSIDKTISIKFGQKLHDVQEWLQLTHWSQKNLNKKSFQAINQKLTELKITNKDLNFEEVVL